VGKLKKKKFGGGETLENKNQKTESTHKLNYPSSFLNDFEFAHEKKMISDTRSVRHLLHIFNVFYIILEFLYFFTWFVTLFVIQSQLSGNMNTAAVHTRLSHLLLSLHFLVPASAIALDTQRPATSIHSLSALYYLVFLAIFGSDYWSLMEAWYSLAPVSGFEYALPLERALATIGTGLTVYWLVWYTVAYFVGRYGKRDAETEADDRRLMVLSHGGQVVDPLKDNEEENDTPEEPLLLRQRVTAAVVVMSNAPRLLVDKKK
jgi:hypothetical protein